MHHIDQKKGGNQKFEELFLSNYTSLFSLGYRMCKDRDFTKDVIQALFLDLWEKQENIGKVEHWNAYLRKAFYRKMLNELKKEKASAEISNPLKNITIPSYEDLLIDLQGKIERQRQLHDALEDLPDQQRKMIEARFITGMSYEEIADTTGKSKQTVYNQIHGAVKKLRNLLGLAAVFLNI